MKLKDLKETMKLVEHAVNILLVKPGPEAWVKAPVREVKLRVPEVVYEEYMKLFGDIDTKAHQEEHPDKMTGFEMLLCDVLRDGVKLRSLLLLKDDPIRFIKHVIQMAGSDEITVMDGGDLPPELHDLLKGGNEDGTVH